MVVNDQVGQNLIDVLHQSDDVKKRVVYMACAYILGEHTNIFTDRSVADFRIEAKSTVYKINEMAIISRDMMLDIFTKMVEYKFYVKTNAVKLIGSSNSFMDLLGLSEYFTEEELKLVDDNYLLFKDAALKFSKWYMPTSKIEG